MLSYSNLTRIFIPDIAQFWTLLWDGMEKSGAFELTTLLGTLALALAFATWAINAIVSGRINLAALVRIVVAALLLTTTPSIRGTNPENGLIWRAVHRTYMYIYGVGSSTPSSSFYATWVAPTVSDASKSIAQGMSHLLFRKALVSASALSLEMIGPLKRVCGGGQDTIDEIARESASLLRSAPVLNGVCALYDRMQKGVDQLNKTMDNAIGQFINALLILLAAHALVIYTTTTSTAIFILLFPLLVGLWPFRFTERALPSATAITLAAILAMPISAVFVAAGTNIAYSVAAANMASAVKNDPDIERAVKDLERAATANSRWASEGAAAAEAFLNAQVRKLRSELNFQTTLYQSAYQRPPADTDPLISLESGKPEPTTTTYWRVDVNQLVQHLITQGPIVWRDADGNVVAPPDVAIPTTIYTIGELKAALAEAIQTRDHLTERANEAFIEFTEKNLNLLDKLMVATFTYLFRLKVIYFTIGIVSMIMVMALFAGLTMLLQGVAGRYGSSVGAPVGTP